MEFGILGPLLVRDETGTHRVSAAKQRTLLAALLLRAGRVVSVDALADTLWDGRPPKSAVASVRNYVTRLRAVLGPAGNRISGRDGGYMIELGPDELDVLRFEALRAEGIRALQEGDVEQAALLLEEAASLWRGPALADVPSDALHREDAPRLTECRLSVLEAKFEAQCRTGRYAMAIAELQVLTAAHPERERLWAQLMTALYRSGRQAEALAAYQRVRRVLTEEVGVEPGSELRELHRRILADEVDEVVEVDPVQPDQPDQLVEAMAPEVPAVPAKPFQVPGDLVDFTGRACETDELVARLSDPAAGVSVAVISGAAGVGKSALAIHVAHAAREAFPDGVLYADLRGGAWQDMMPGIVLGSFLRALGYDGEAVPGGVDGQAALFRSLIADRRMLIVLDNAASSTQLGFLLPGTASSAALVTSRRHLGEMSVGCRVDLGPLTPPESALLLGRIVGRPRTQAEPLAVAEVTAACERLPLALRIAGGRLVARPHWQVRHLAERLVDERARLDMLVCGDLELRSRFRASYQALEEDEARAFRLLSLVDPARLGVESAATVLGERAGRAEALLEALVDARLLMSETPGRYRYSLLVRTFARETAFDTDSVSDRLRAVHAPAMPRAVDGASRKAEVESKVATESKSALKLVVTI